MIDLEVVDASSPYFIHGQRKLLSTSNSKFGSHEIEITPKRVMRLNPTSPCLSIYIFGGFVLFLVAQSLKGQVPDLAETYDYFPISSIVVRCYCELGWWQKYTVPSPSLPTQQKLLYPLKVVSISRKKCHLKINEILCLL